MNLKKNKETDQLFESILSLKNKEEYYRFFGDLCTISEMKSISQRLKVAQMLCEGSTYLDITEETNRSSAVISRIKSCLYYGSGGYQLVIDRLRALKEGNQK